MWSCRARLFEMPLVCVHKCSAQAGPRLDPQFRSLKCPSGNIYLRTLRKLAVALLKSLSGGKDELSLAQFVGFVEALRCDHLSTWRSPCSATFSK